MATKLPKISFPRTSDGFQKKIDTMSKTGIKTREDAYKFTILNLKSIEFEMERCEAYKNNPLIAGLLERYGKLKERWEKSTLWELSAHVPLFVRGPGVRVGTSPRPARTSSGSPVTLRSLASARLIADALSCRRRAAPTTLPSASSTSSVTSRFRSSPAIPHK